MSAFHRKPARSITFTDKDGAKAGTVRVGEIGKRGNKHFGSHQPDGPRCGQPIEGKRGGISFCPESWKPVCPNPDCPGNFEVRKVMRIEKYGRKKHERRGP